MTPETHTLGESPLPLSRLPERPLVSILVANYNYERFIGSALNSVLAQTYPNLEAIVCDDGSIDGSRQLVERFVSRDERVRLIVKENGGAASALNTAREAAKGEVLCTLDADDTFHPSKVERVVKAFRSHPWGLLVHALMLVDENGMRIQRKPAFGYFEEGWIADKVRRRGGRWGYMEASGVCLRREVADIVFPIPEERFRSWADAYVCVLGAFITRVGFIDEALASYRIHGENISGSNLLTEARGRRGMEGFRRLVEGVDERLHALDPSDPGIRVGDNLGYLESRLMTLLLSPKASYRGIVRAYLDYARSVLSDDIYGRSRKLLSVVFPATAMLLPVPVRPAWVSAGLTHSRTKERLRRMARALTSVRRLVDRSRPVV